MAMINLPVSSPSTQPLPANTDPRVVGTRQEGNKTWYEFDRSVSVETVARMLIPDIASMKVVPPKFEISGGGNVTLHVTTRSNKTFEVYMPSRGCFGPPIRNFSLEDITSQIPAQTKDSVKVQTKSGLLPPSDLFQRHGLNPNADLTLKRLVNSNPQFTYTFDRPPVSLRDLLPLMAPGSRFVSEEHRQNGVVLTYLNREGNQEHLSWRYGQNEVQKDIYRDPSLPGMGGIMDSDRDMFLQQDIKDFNRRLKGH